MNGKLLVSWIDRAALNVGALGAEPVRHTHDEIEPNHDVLVLGSIHVGSRLVGSRPENMFDARACTPSVRGEADASTFPTQEAVGHRQNVRFCLP